MRIFSFFMEPSSYTTDLIRHVHQNEGIEYAYIYDTSLAKTDVEQNVPFLNRMSLWHQVQFVIQVFKNNEFIIFNGYNRWEFLLLFFLNTIARKKRFIAIESDTQFKNMQGWRSIIKRLYLSTIFTSRHTLGFSGGSVTHKELFRYYGMPEERIFLLPMMVNSERFYRNGQIFQKDKFTFLYVGRVVPVKNIEFLIQSFIETFHPEQRVCLKIVGTGELLEFYRNKYKEFHNIVFVGAKFGEDLVQEYHSANALVLPSTEEPWGLVVNEALSAGVPVLASKSVGAVHDLIVGRGTGMVFEVNDSKDLSEKMLLLYNNPEEYQKYCHNAEELMRTFWNYDLYRQGLYSALKYVEMILGRERMR